MNRLLREEIEKMNREQAERKRAAWDLIKSRSPGTADFLTAINGAFGKPASISVCIDGKQVI